MQEFFFGSFLLNNSHDQVISFLLR